MSPFKRICVFEHSVMHVLTAHAQPFRGTRDLAFCLKVPLDSLLVWASSGGSGETARMRRLAWTFAARIGYKNQIRLMAFNNLSDIPVIPQQYQCCSIFTFAVLSHYNIVQKNIRQKFDIGLKWAGSWDKSTYYIGKQQRLRQACASTQSGQNLRCSPYTIKGTRESIRSWATSLAPWVAVQHIWKVTKCKTLRCLFSRDSSNLVATFTFKKI